MNAKLRITTAAVVAFGTLALVAGPVNAAPDEYSRRGAVYDYAKVINVQPIIRYVTVTTPVQECWEEAREYVIDRRPAGAAGGTLFGAIIGGVIGHQFGSGRGNDAATAAGALLGAAVGSDSARRGNRGYERETYTRPVKRCETNYSSREEERIEGYDVTYRYHGQKYATRMPYDPGERLRIRVDVRPAN